MLNLEHEALLDAIRRRPGMYVGEALAGARDWILDEVVRAAPGFHLRPVRAG